MILVTIMLLLVIIVMTLGNCAFHSDALYRELAPAIPQLLRLLEDSERAATIVSITIMTLTVTTLTITLTLTLTLIYIVTLTITITLTRTLTLTLTLFSIIIYSYYHYSYCGCRRTPTRRRGPTRPAPSGTREKTNGTTLVLKCTMFELT